MDHLVLNTFNIELPANAFTSLAFIQKIVDLLNYCFFFFCLQFQRGSPQLRTQPSYLLISVPPLLDFFIGEALSHNVPYVYIYTCCDLRVLYTFIFKIVIKINMKFNLYFLFLIQSPGKYPLRLPILYTTYNEASCMHVVYYLY